MHNLGLDGTGTDRVEPMLSVRCGPSESPFVTGSARLSDGYVLPGVTLSSDVDSDSG
jgi:hypothetical protein